MGTILSTQRAVGEIHFKKKEIFIGKHKISAELAENAEQHAQGLMYRKELKEGTGMLFIFSDEQQRTFWMKNTFIPLSIGYINAQKKLIDIQDMVPVKSEMEQSPPVYPSAGPAKFALEVPRGWFHKKKVKLGDLLSYK